jgi:hypothetical protein
LGAGGRAGKRRQDQANGEDSGEEHATAFLEVDERWGPHGPPPASS